MRPKRIILWMAVLLIGVGVPVALWVLSSSGVSPEQRIADAEPPAPPTVDVAVEERVLRDVVVFRGVVASVEQHPVSAPDLGDLLPVVVDLPVGVGEPVASGQVVAVVSDRPVIVVGMPVPLYRALTRGVVGEDVSRFQRALIELGYEVEVDGLFGRETQAATKSLYEELGFEAATEGEGRAAQVLVPLGEIVGVASFPAVVASVNATVGSVADGPLLFVTTSELVVDATVETSMAPLLAAGTRAIAEGDWELEVLSNTGRDETGRAVVRLGALEALPAEMLGRDLRIEAELVATEGPVLAVPVTAIRSGADGELIRVVGPDGGVRSVGVRTGVSVGGWVEIVSADEELSPGTLVRVG
jgi:hypothetical protein